MKNPNHHTTPPKAMTIAVGRVLRPLVRGFIRFGLTWPLAADIIKRTYVDIANEDFKTKPDKPPTDSRISLLTRVHRKDIRRFRLETTPAPLNLSDSSVGAQIIARWQAGAPYLDAQGQPKPLPRTGEFGFDHLARGISKDTHPRAILDELLRGGAVIVDNENHVHLDTSAFIPAEDFEGLAWYYGLNLHDHIAASTHNISGNTPAFLDRAVHYSGLTPASVAELEKLSKDMAMEILLSVNAKAQELEARDKGRAEANQRMTFGAYFYGEADENPDVSLDGNPDENPQQETSND